MTSTTVPGDEHIDAMFAAYTTDEYLYGADVKVEFDPELLTKNGKRGIRITQPGYSHYGTRLSHLGAMYFVLETATKDDGTWYMNTAQTKRQADSDNTIIVATEVFADTDFTADKGLYTGTIVTSIDDLIKSHHSYYDDRKRDIIRAMNHDESYAGFTVLDGTNWDGVLFIQDGQKYIAMDDYYLNENLVAMAGDKYSDMLSTFDTELLAEVFDVSPKITKALKHIPQGLWAVMKATTGGPKRFATKLMKKFPERAWMDQGAFRELTAEDGTVYTVRPIGTHMSGVFLSPSEV